MNLVQLRCASLRSADLRTFFQRPASKSYLLAAGLLLQGCCLLAVQWALRCAVCSAEGCCRWAAARCRAAVCSQCGSGHCAALSRLRAAAAGSLQGCCLPSLALSALYCRRPAVVFFVSMSLRPFRATAPQGARQRGPKARTARKSRPDTNRQLLERPLPRRGARASSEGALAGAADSQHPGAPRASVPPRP
jgi:hypothetical protein